MFMRRRTLYVPDVGRSSRGCHLLAYGSGLGEVCCTTCTMRQGRPHRRVWLAAGTTRPRAEAPPVKGAECAPEDTNGAPGTGEKSCKVFVVSWGNAQAGQPGATQEKAPGRALVAADVHGTVVGQAMPGLLLQEPGLMQ